MYKKAKFSITFYNLILLRYLNNEKFNVFKYSPFNVFFFIYSVTTFFRFTWFTNLLIFSKNIFFFYFNRLFIYKNIHEMLVIYNKHANKFKIYLFQAKIKYFDVGTWKYLK